jgi:hypothetical protein
MRANASSSVVAISFGGVAPPGAVPVAGVPVPGVAPAPDEVSSAMSIPYFLRYSNDI